VRHHIRRSKETTVTGKKIKGMGSAFRFHLWPLCDQHEFEEREHLRIALLSDSEPLRALTDLFERVKRRTAAIEGLDMGPLDFDQLSDDQGLCNPQWIAVGCQDKGAANCTLRSK